jgi:arylmalonate decarboxylase
MTVNRREFLQIGSAITLSSAIASGAAKPLLGLIHPPKDVRVPDEATRLYGSRVQFKMYGLDLSSITSTGFDAVIDKLTPAAVELKGAGANGIVLFGTSLTFYKGRKYNEELIESARKATGLPTTSMSSAVIDGLKAAGARRIAVATAYDDNLNTRLRTFLLEHEFVVQELEGLGITSISGPKAVPQAELQEFCAGVYRKALKKADALLISCGGLLTLDIIEPLEKICKVPVVSSTPHALWAGVQLVGVNSKVKGFGKVIAKKQIPRNLQNR